jgi:hypothetical protein
LLQEKEGSEMKYNKYNYIGFIFWLVGLIILGFKVGWLIAFAVWLVSFGNNTMIKGSVYMLRDYIIGVVKTDKK